MVYHILNGDSLACSFPETGIEGETVVVREALIDGDLSGQTLEAFWRSRADSLQLTETEYRDSVVREFEKIRNAPEGSEFNLWFEYDLFCQVNSWFVISILRMLPVRKKVFAVFTTYLDETDQRFWNGFGPAKTDELNACFADRILLGETDLEFGHTLWTAYKNGDLRELTGLSRHRSPAFPYLEEVVNAHVERFPGNGVKGRPEKVIEDIVQNVSSDFHEVCKAFWKRESIYGFGDVQVKRLYERVMQNR